MTTTNSRPVFNYPHANGRLYDLTDCVKVLNIRDAIDSGFARLHAMLAMTTGECGEAFRCHNDTTQEMFLDACNLLAKEIHELYKQLKHRTFNAGQQSDEDKNIAGKHS